jgi:hypothetical protein
MAATKPTPLGAVQLRAAGHVTLSEPINVEDIDLRDYTRIEAPIINASTANIQSTGHEYILMLARARPMEENTRKGLAPFATSEIVAMLSLSPQLLKDLSILFDGQVKVYEKQFGAIKTPLSMAQETAQDTIRQAVPRGRRTKGH